MQEVRTLRPEINEMFERNPSLRVAFALGRDERLNPGLEVFDYYSVGATNKPEERIPLKEMFFLPDRNKDWIDGWVNFSTPEEVENQLAFYLGANYINDDEYQLLSRALTLSRQIHGSEKRKDGLRRSLDGHILPGMRFIFDNRKEIVDSILMEEGGEPLSFFESLFVYLGHDWIEDVKDEQLREQFALFPDELIRKIQNLSKTPEVREENGYLDSLKTAGKVEKFVKMVDRMMNLLDDRGKSPPLGSSRRSKGEEYLVETRTYYMEMFREAQLPLFDKFEQVVSYVEQDSKLSRDFLDIVQELVNASLGLPNTVRSSADIVASAMDKSNQNRERSTKEKLAHIERMVSDLMANSTRFGILPSTGMVGAIYFHDLVNDTSFIDRVRSKLNELDSGENRNLHLARLLRYSTAVAHSSRVVENKSRIERDLIDRLYRDQREPVKVMLRKVFARPHTRTKRGSDYQQTLGEFESNRINMYRIAPAAHEIKFQTFKDCLEYDIEGVLLRFLEVRDNILNPNLSDPTYAWRNCQESLYFLLPLVEAFGLKGPAKELANVIHAHVVGELMGEDFVNNVSTELKRISDSPEIKLLEKIINRIVGDSALIEYDRKGIGSSAEKRMKEALEVITDLARCRIVLPPTDRDDDVLIKSMGIIEEVVSQARNAGLLHVNISRPFKPTGDKNGKRPLRISLPPEGGTATVADRMISDIKERLGIPELEIIHEFVERPTGYKDVKVVFQIPPNDGGEPYYYEMIITESFRYKNNLFGTAARVARQIVGSTQENVGRKITQEHRNLLTRLSHRTISYMMFSSSGTNLARFSLSWLRKMHLGNPDNLDDDDILGFVDGLLTRRIEYLVR